MKYLPLLFLIFLCFPALSQDRIELGYQTSKRGIEWVRPGLPTHVPAWRVSRDTNAIIWHDKSTGMRYDFSYLTETWFARGTFSSTLPPLPTQTSGSATIDNRTGFWLNASNVLHRYDKTQTAWVPFKISFQSAAPSNVASGVSNGAAIYTTSLWQDSDDYLVYYWDGDSWELLSGAGTNLTYTGTSSPVTLNSSTGTDVTVTAGTNISISATGTNLTINNTGAAALSGVVNQVPYFNTTSTITTEAGSGANSLTWDNTNNRLGVGTTSPSAVIEAAVPASTNGIVSNYTYAIGMSQRPLKVVNQDGLETFAIGGNRTSNEGNIFLNAPSVQGGGAGITFSANNGATPVTGLFQLDNSGNLVFRQGSAGSSLFYDFGSGVYFRNSSFSNVDHINGSGWLSIAAGNTHPRTLYVNGEARIADLTTDTPTGVVGADADGDLGLLAFSGMSIISGTLTATDASTTNELQTISVSANTTTLSNSGGSMTIAGGGINTVGTAGSTITITGTEVDGSVSNEGSLTVGAGSGTTSIINSNTSGSTGVTLTAGSGLTISETGNVITLANSAPDQTVSITGAGINVVTGTYPNFTVTGTEVDGSVTNEAQTLSTSGTTSGILNLSTAGGAGGGTATIAAGTGITVGQSGGTITITNSSPATAGWLLDGNTITAAKRIGSNDNFDVVVETNNTDRIFIDNAGTVSIGGTQLTTAALNINGLQTGTGMLIAGGGSLVGPNFYTATGSGTGSTATVLSGVLSMISGNVEALLKNTATTGTGGGSVITLNVSPTATSNDPFIKWQTEATTDWSMGIDNDDVDDLKLHRFSRPSDNNGQGTIEFGYRTNDIGIAVNKTGIGTGTNGFYAFDAYGKIRTDQYVNNALDISNSAFATIALGTAAGTSPTVDNTITSVWGNGAHLKFTSGSSPTANGVICTVTLDSAYTFGDCVSNISARTTNASGFGYSSTFNSATRVITFTLNGTLTASTVYEFNLMFFGRN